MALYDNKYWLLTHIRHSFISSDDTGMCEIVMSGEDISHLKSQLEKYPDLDLSDDSDGLSIESGDLSFGMDFGMRARTNTAARIEKIEQAKKKAAKVRLIKWDPKKLNVDDKTVIDNMFEKVDPEKNVQIVKKSLLSQRLQECVNLPKNPYLTYAKFDGNGHVNIPTRRYKIFLTMLENENKNVPLDVSCVATAKVIELIGLILFTLSNRNSTVTLHPPTHYGLYITEEDGEVYRDLPPLEAKECVAKFGFTCLGLVEHKDAVVSFDESVKENQENGKTGSEGQRKPDKEPDEIKQITSDLEVMAVHKKAMEAPLYQSYQVNIITKMRPKVEVHLGVSGDKIEIDPIQPQNSKFSLTKLKPVSCHIDSVAWCEVTETRSSRTQFRLFYSNSYGTGKISGEKAGSHSSPLQTSASFKHFDFEADHTTAEEIVEKINLILDLRSSQSRKEYVAARERKQYKRKGFNIHK
ncbi:stress-activated map kinase-interacting protein 1 isoform X2 [Coccinella septempunctata]|uniref:stress-activated map kinase-interacting protein 1 isoform X2 n=1 Tax=Coccinella septempunctata TaxID=41139 RepID=UPI001D083A06|nr:stress-activated map kinase-interacting protein 1 isoform X2 [Coccinella septempunctata]